MDALKRLMDEVIKEMGKDEVSNDVRLYCKGLYDGMNIASVVMSFTGVNRELDGQRLRDIINKK